MNIQRILLVPMGPVVVFISLIGCGDKPSKAPDVAGTISSPGILLADGSTLDIPPAWADTFGFSYYFPEMRVAHWLDGKPSPNKVYVPSMSRVDDPSGRGTPQAQLKDAADFSGGPEVEVIVGSQLVRLKYPETPKSHPEWHLPDHGETFFGARPDAPFYTALQCSLEGGCKGDVLIKSLNIQYAIEFSGQENASDIIVATNKLIGSWIIQPRSRVKN